MKNEKYTPNLFVPGAAKSGTSSLHEYLDQHPEIFMSLVKEPHFFSNHYNEMSSGKSWADYLGLFNEGSAARYRGESSTGYMVFPNVIERIKQNIKNPKFIFLLRNPIDRAFSHYNWVKSFGKENRSFKEAILFDKNKEPDPGNSFGYGYKYYFQFGLYSKWLSRFREDFDDDQIIIVTTEQLKNNPLDTLNRCCDFLKISHIGACDQIISNQTVYYTNPAGFIKFKNFIKSSRIPAGFRGKAPEQLRGIYRKIKKSMISRIEKKFIAKGRPVLDIDQRTWLRGLYETDIAALKKSIGQDFSEWQDFKHIN